jgi:hypothetical protein
MKPSAAKAARIAVFVDGLKGVPSKAGVESLYIKET